MKHFGPGCQHPLEYDTVRFTCCQHVLNHYTRRTLWPIMLRSRALSQSSSATSQMGISVITTGDIPCICKAECSSEGATLQAMIPVPHATLQHGLKLSLDREIDNLVFVVSGLAITP